MPIYTWGDCLYKKSQGSYRKSLRTNKWVQQGCRIKGIQKAKWMLPMIMWTLKHKNIIPIIIVQEERSTQV